MESKDSCTYLSTMNNEQKTMIYTQEQLEKVKGFEAIELKQEFEDRILEIENILQNEIMPINGVRYLRLESEKNRLKIDRCKIRVF